MHLNITKRAGPLAGVLIRLADDYWLQNSNVNIGRAYVELFFI